VKTRPGHRIRAIVIAVIILLLIFSLGFILGRITLNRGGGSTASRFREKGMAFELTQDEISFSLAVPGLPERFTYNLAGNWDDQTEYEYGIMFFDGESLYRIASEYYCRSGQTFQGGFEQMSNSLWLYNLVGYTFLGNVTAKVEGETITWSFPRDEWFYEHSGRSVVFESEIVNIDYDNIILLLPIRYNIMQNILG